MQQHTFALETSHPFLCEMVECNIFRSSFIEAADVPYIHFTDMSGHTFTYIVILCSVIVHLNT
jgi:hypothetical protein